ncbi:hypothetical protein BGW80DRAFT_1558036 [Lactifluus volemus]|nr:hypothetical protein BGW80DRAFT_1558036 [Lactifluus volemus]
MPTLPQGRLLVLFVSIILSCASIGISISIFCHFKRPQSQSQSHPPGSYMDSTGPDEQGLPYVNFGPYNGHSRTSSLAVPILGLVSSLLNIVLALTLLFASAMKRRTILTAVAIEAPCLYVVSVLWLATGIFIAHCIDSGLLIGATTRFCTENRVLAGLSFINWIQLMIYANTVMTVATICHVRKQGVWLRSVTELPTFGAPALTFDSTPDKEFDSLFYTKTNESQHPIVGVSSQTVDSRTQHHFRSRITLPSHSLIEAQTLSTTPSPPPSHLPIHIEILPATTSPSPPPLPSPTDPVASSIPTVSTQSDPTQNTDGHARSSTGHHIALTGDPPIYSNPGSDYELSPL